MSSDASPSSRHLIHDLKKIEKITEREVRSGKKKQHPYYMFFQDRKEHVFLVAVNTATFENLNKLSTPVRFKEGEISEIKEPFSAILDRYDLTAKNLSEIRIRGWVERMFLHAHLFLLVRGNPVMLKEGRTLLNFRPYRWVKYYVTVGTNCAQTDILFQSGVKMKDAGEYTDYPVEWLEFNF